MKPKSTILIVDSDRVLLDLLTQAWSSQHIAVLGCITAEEARHLIEVRVPDVLLLDPSIANGLSLTAAVRALSPERTKIIAMTSDADVRQRAMVAGVEKVVDRNRGFDALRDAVQKVLRLRLGFVERPGGNVLIADQDEGIRELLKEFLSKRGFGVSIADHGRKAIELARAGGDIDVVLVSMNMPDMSGLEVLGEIIRAGVQSHVIMIAEIVDRELARQAVKAGASDYIVKPFDFEVIESSIIACRTEKRPPWWQASR
jgi:DNA-binding NtrC family response regulator